MCRIIQWHFKSVHLDVVDVLECGITFDHKMGTCTWTWKGKKTNARSWSNAPSLLHWRVLLAERGVSTTLHMHDYISKCNLKALRWALVRYWEKTVQGLAPVLRVTAGWAGKRARDWRSANDPPTMRLTSPTSKRDCLFWIWGEEAPPLLTTNWIR